MKDHKIQALRHRREAIRSGKFPGGRKTYFRRCIFTGAVLQRVTPSDLGCPHPDCPNHNPSVTRAGSCSSCRNYHSPGVTVHSLDGIRHQ